MYGTLTADGSTPSFKTKKGPAHVHVSGDFDGGTFTVEFKDQSGTWRAIAGAALTEASDKLIDFPYPVEVRGTLSGATSPSLVYSFR